MTKSRGIRLCLTQGLACLLIFQGPALSAAADDLIIKLDEGDTGTAPSSQKTVKDRTQQAQEEFVPLLAPLPRPKMAASRASNVFHGRLRWREFYQKINNGTYDLASRLESRGSVERIQGDPLSLTWDGNLSYRNGNSFTTATDFEQPRLHLFQLMLAQKQKDGGIGRAGRFIPTELPGLGYLDGVQLDRHPADKVHLGAAAGARPDRRELGLSSRELITSAYGNYEYGSLGKEYYFGTLGFFQSLFSGVRDELGMLYDHRADLGPKLNLYFSSQVNFNSGAARVHTEDARLTRVDFYANSPVTKTLAFRAGLDHFERPDTAAERDLTGTDNLDAFDNGYWRYWTGSHQRIFWNCQLDEEVALIKAPGQSDQGQVRGTLSRQGVFRMTQALLSFTVYSLNRIDGNGVGSIVSGNFPLLNNHLNVVVNSGFRYSAPEGEPKSFRANDASIYLNWLISKAWEADLGLIQTYQDYIQSTLADFSLSYRW